MSKKKNNIKNILYITLFILSIYFSFFYRAADWRRVKPYENIEDYPVYSGRDSYEYWKTKLDDNQKILYEEMKEAYLQFIEWFSTDVKDISEDDFQEVYAAVLLDHPEIFWMNSYQLRVNLLKQKNVNTGKKIRLFYYYNKDEAIEIKNRIEPKYKSIIEEADKKENGDFDKILYVHDSLINLAKYRDYTVEERKEFQNIVSIFDKGETVCAGYSYGFKFIMDQLGIDCVLVRDIDNVDEDSNHIWNMVKYDDVWYNIDVTGDASLKNNENGQIIYNFFMKDNEEFYKTHKMQENMPQN